MNTNPMPAVAGWRVMLRVSKHAAIECDIIGWFYGPGHEAAVQGWWPIVSVNRGRGTALMKESEFIVLGPHDVMRDSGDVVRK